MNQRILMAFFLFDFFFKKSQSKVAIIQSLAKSGYTPEMKVFEKMRIQLLYSIKKNLGTRNLFFP